jgi:hypothetical protein
MTGERDAVVSSLACASGSVPASVYVYVEVTKTTLG